MADTTKIGRIAFREEGSLWCAYYAMPDTMEDALFLGSIRMAAVVGNRRRKQAFMDLMRDVVGEILRQSTGHAVTWHDPVAAPPHERGGRA